MLLEILLAATETPAAETDSSLSWLYLVIPALFGGYGVATIISHITKRQTEAGTQKLEGTRLGQDIMEKALVRLDKEVAELRARDDAHEAERDADRQERELILNINAAMMRYMRKLATVIRESGGEVPAVDAADAVYLQELSLATKDHPVIA